MNPSMTWDGCGSVLITIDTIHWMDTGGSQIAPCMVFTGQATAWSTKRPPRSKHSGAIWAHKRSASKLAMENPSICRWISIEKEGEHDIQICQIRCVLYINYICTYIIRGLEAASRELIFLFSWCLPKKVQYSSFFKLESKTIYASCYPKTSCNVRNAHVTLTLYYIIYTVYIYIYVQL